MKAGIWTLIGFVLFLVGFVAIILSFISVKLAFLTWLDVPGPLFGLIMKLVMVVLGAVIIVLSRTDWEAENEGDGRLPG